MPPDTLVDALGAKAGGGEPERRGIVHRLDRDTSGLMVVARERGGAQAPVGARAQARARAHLPRARPGPAALPQRPDRGADRPRPRRADPDVARQRRARATPSRTSRSTGSGRATPCSGCGSRRGACTRFASISPRSTCRSSATPSTASPSLARTPVPARLAARVPASLQRGADRGARRVAARAGRIPRLSSNAAPLRWAARSLPSDPAGRPKWRWLARSGESPPRSAGFCQSKP